MAKSALEERLEAITREFVQQIVATIRNASFADVAGYAPEAGRTARRPPPPTRVEAVPKAARRQGADRRAELSERVVDALRSAGGPLGVRALSSDLGVPPDALAKPLRELRAAGRVAKHGEKRATTYSLA
jgi:hypothetical protein